jgi:uridine phosphorylase
MPSFPESELILSPQGQVYHLHLRPEEIADTIITVGDPDRVAQVSQYFDAITFKTAKREFITHTGRIGKKPITVISTGIGPDNIDIVLNELDALVNIDFATREAKSKSTSLKIIRLGTSGGLQADIAPGDLVLSAYGMGLDNLMAFYQSPQLSSTAKMAEDWQNAHGISDHFPVKPYFTAADPHLLQQLSTDLFTGITLTCPGFYGPQGRQLRAATQFSGKTLEGLAHFSSQGQRVTNFEMETSAIYGLAQLLGHQAVSCNVIIANRINQTFSPKPEKAILKMIEKMLERIEKII